LVLALHGLQTSDRAQALQLLIDVGLDPRKKQHAYSAANACMNSPKLA
jgi:hypothetical protein